MTEKVDKIKVAVLGTGGWGTALANLLSEKGINVALWSHNQATADEINSQHSNSSYLAGVNLNVNLTATANPEIIADSDIIINAIPTQFISRTLDSFRINLSGKMIINGSKGVEKGSLLRISEIFYKHFGVSSDNYAIVTGPSHAEEVARKFPTTVVAASENYDLTKMAQQLLSTDSFRVYSSDDVIGCEIGGSLKNVIAIAAGIIDGLELGDNTKAALITRGLAEISRLGIALGARPLTFSGLSGLGDLFVTCNSKHSRNRRAGELIGKGKTIDEISTGTKMIAEGIGTTESAWNLARKHDVELPITEQIYKIIFESKAPLEAINELMTRSSKKEIW